VLGVEGLVGLALEFHRGSYNGITVPNYRNTVPGSIDPHQAKPAPPARPTAPERAADSGRG